MGKYALLLWWMLLAPAAALAQPAPDALVAAMPADAANAADPAKAVRSITRAFDNGAGRMVPISIWAMPTRTRGTVYFSHGALSAPDKYRAMTLWLARSGYAVIAPLHADSTDWTGARPGRADQISWRLADMALARRAAPDLIAAVGARTGRGPVLAAGHSFGALIAMLDPDPAVRAVIAWSPPGPVPGLTIPTVQKPLLTITGTADIVPPVAPTWQAHLAAHEAATGPAAACIGAGADHYFGGIFGRPEAPGPRQSEAFDAAMAQMFRFISGFARPSLFGPGGAARALAAQGCRVRNVAGR